MNASDYDALGLLPQHAELLAASAISPKVAKKRGCWSVTKKVELKDLGFSDHQCRVPALVLPVHGVTGDIVLHQIRPDEPRANSEGKKIKYETPKGAKMALDVPPTMRQFLKNPKRPLFITEGIKKADSAASHGLCCLAVLGVWNWRGANDEGGKTVLAAWEDIALKDRAVYVVFDSDVMHKPDVYAALVRLKAFLESRGARVRIIYLEPQQDGSKVGFDDFFKAGGTVTTLYAQATDKLRPSPQEDRPFPYIETPLGLLWRKPTRDGAVDTPLCNFTARIVTMCEEDDGVETRRVFEIAVKQGDRVVTVRIPGERFNAMNWPIEALGADAAIVPGPMARDRIRYAVQIFSTGAPRRKLYAHLGWRKIGEQWVYLHARGAIGEAGSVPDIEVAVPAALDHFALPDPPEGDALTTALHASLHVLTVAPGVITFPLVAAVYRAVLGETDLAVHLAGPTGVGKSELAALAQQHYGADLDARHLPASWISTGNALEGVAFVAKDALIVIDDFAPTGSTADVQRLHRDADRVFRAQGNRSGRMRMSSEAHVKSAKPPRGMVLSTGEDIPRGQSLRARLFTIEPSPGDVAWTVLSQCQRDAAEGLYAQALAGFLRWLAPRYETVKKGLKREMEDLRAHAEQGGHKRTPEITANLALGFRYLLQFACDARAISADEQQQLWRACWKALSTAASSQAKHHEANEPAARFLDLVNAALASGKAHLASPTGGPPIDPEAWGWRLEGETWTAKGARIGWLDSEDLYLQPDASYACVQDLARSQGDSLPVSVQTIRRRLKEKGYLASWDEATQTTTVRRTLEGKQQPVLHLRKSILQEGLSLHKKPSKPSKPDESQGTGEDSPANAGFPETQQEAQPSKPSTGPASKSTVKTSPNGVNAGFAGLEIGREPLPHNTKIPALFAGETDAGFAGFLANQNPASPQRNPANAEKTEAHEPAPPP